MIERAPQNKGKVGVADPPSSTTLPIETKVMTAPLDSAILAAQAEFAETTKATAPIIKASRPIGRGICPRCKVSCELYAEGPEFDRKIRYEGCRCGKGA